MIQIKPSLDERLNLHPMNFLTSLSAEDKMLLQLKEELYQGKWDNMIDDLNRRLNSRPYLFKLHMTIEEDRKRIEILREYETKNNVDLYKLISA